MPPPDLSAVERCQRRLAGLSRDAQPYEWACDQVNLGNAWLDLGGSDRAVHVERAIAAYEKALEVFARETHPYEWGITQMNLNAACNQRLREDRAAHLERAIAHGDAALEALTRETAPVERAEALMNLGSSWRDRLRGSRGENLERAIALYREALATSGLTPFLEGCLRLNLGIAFDQRIHGDRAENVEQAIAAFDAALTRLTREVDAGSWVLAQMNRAAALSERVRGDRRENLENALRGYEAALTVVTREVDPFTWAVLQQNLGTAWGDRLEGERRDNLERAIGCANRALEVLTPEETPIEWSRVHASLGDLFLARIAGDPAENRERAIAEFHRVLEVLTPEAAPHLWAGAQASLGNAWGLRLRGDRADNLEAAIACHRRALEVRTREELPALWASSTMSLGVLHVNRIHGDRAANVEEALRLLQSALEVRTREASPRDWASAMLNLGMAWRNRPLGEPAENLEQAIACFEQCLEVRTRDAAPLEWAAAQMNLGIALSHRLRGDRAGNLEEAIAAYHRALEVWTRTGAPLDHALARMNLGTAYLRRIHGDAAENLEEAIRCFDAALEIHTRESLPADWGTAMVNRGSAWARLPSGDRAGNLERAIRDFRAALEVRTREASPVDWGLTLLNLGAALTHRARGDRTENLEEAIEAGRGALEVLRRDSAPQMWAFLLGNLGFAYSRRLRGEREENVEEAIRCYRAALEELRPDTIPDKCRSTAADLAALCFAEERWTEAAAAYRTALEAAEVLYRSSLLWASQAAELAAVPDLYRNAAFCQARAGSPEAAAVTLERGRARALSEALARDQARLEDLAHRDPVAHESYREAAARLRALEAEERSAGPGWSSGGLLPIGEPWREAKRQARAELETAVERIRARSGYHDFLRAPDLPEILRAGRPERPLVYLATTPAGSLGLIVAGEGEPVEEVRCGLRLSELEALGAAGYLPGQTADGGDLRTHLPGLLERLGEGLIAPLAARLRARRAEAVVLVPCGSLALLPLHAARDSATGRHLLDDFDVSLTPSARVLNAARAALSTRPPAAMELAGVGNPLPPPSGLEPLPGAEAELRTVAALFPAGSCRVFYREAATREALLEAAAAASHVHLGCHGAFDPADPLRSALFLADGEITLRELLARPPFPAARLVVLSACRTAVTEAAVLPDEGLGLPSGILQAGVPGVVGSLWQADDLVASLLMVRFWELVRGGGERPPLEPARALRRARLWLRDVTAGELRDWARPYRTPPLREHPLASVALEVAGRVAACPPEEAPFAQPSDWAPFVLLGA